MDDTPTNKPGPGQLDLSSLLSHGPDADSFAPKPRRRLDDESSAQSELVADPSADASLESPEDGSSAEDEPVAEDESLSEDAVQPESDGEGGAPEKPAPTTALDIRAAFEAAAARFRTRSPGEEPHDGAAAAEEAEADGAQPEASQAGQVGETTEEEPARPADEAVDGSVLTHDAPVVTPLPQQADTDEDGSSFFASIETPDELRSTPGAAQVTSFYEDQPLHPPALDRERPERPPLVPRWVWIALAALVAVIVVGTGIAIAVSSSGRVTVPDVRGESLALAKTELAEVGLEAEVTERRFSGKPTDEVLSQSPAPSGEARRGDVVQLIVSAGNEEFTMPDVVGNGVVLATGMLEGKGLEVVVESVISDVESDTVLSSTPAPGAIVRTGDTVRLQVASPRPGSAQLKPYLMTGLTITLDPAPVPDGKTDVTLEVARRLRSLFEASGATVVVLRSAADTVTTDASRKNAARAAASTFSLGLSADVAGNGGRSVVAPSAATSLTASQASVIASSVVAQLTKVAPPVKSGRAISDRIFGGPSTTWVRVSLGSYASRADTISFSDPQWADRVARAIYSGVGEVLGTGE